MRREQFISMARIIINFFFNLLFRVLSLSTTPERIRNVKRNGIVRFLSIFVFVVIRRHFLKKIMNNRYRYCQISEVS